MEPSVTHLTSKTIGGAVAVTKTMPVHSLVIPDHILTSTVSDQTKPVTKDLLFENTYSSTSTFSPNPTTPTSANRIIDTFTTVAVGIAFLGLIFTSLTTSTIVLLWYKVKHNKRLAKTTEPPNNDFIDNTAYGGRPVLGYIPPDEHMYDYPTVSRERQNTALAKKNTNNAKTTDPPNNEAFIDNTAYGGRPVLGYIPPDEHMYDYPTVSRERQNTALAKKNTNNAVCAPSHADISVSRNCAYQSPSLTADIATSSNEAYLSADGNQSLTTIAPTAFFFNINHAYQESHPDTATAYDNVVA